MKCILPLIAAVVGVTLCLSALRLRILNATTSGITLDLSFGSFALNNADFRAALSTIAAPVAAAFFGTYL